MSKGFRVALGIWLLALGVAIGLDWLADGPIARSRSEEARRPSAAESARAVPPRLPVEGSRVAAVVPPARPEPPRERPEDAVRPRRDDVEEGIEAVVETGGAAVAPPAASPRRDADTSEMPVRRAYDGDLGRASLKSAPLGDRSRERLGGGDLGAVSRTLRPGGSLGEASLAGVHLRDRTRERLGGADLRDRVSAEPGNLGARSLESVDLRDRSRGEDDRGDLADRSAR